MWPPAGRCRRASMPDAPVVAVQTICLRRLVTPRVLPPFRPRAARSHWASVGSRKPAQAQNAAASYQLTFTTGRDGYCCWSAQPSGSLVSPKRRPATSVASDSRHPRRNAGTGRRLRDTGRCGRHPNTLRGPELAIIKSFLVVVRLPGSFDWAPIRNRPAGTVTQ